jgi:hypothetical protein
LERAKEREKGGWEEKGGVEAEVRKKRLMRCIVRRSPRRRDAKSWKARETFSLSRRF